MKRRMIALLMVMVMCCTMFAGCSGSNGNTTAADGATEAGTKENTATTVGSEEPVTLKIMAVNSDQMISDMYKARMEEFEKLHPNVTMEIEELTFKDFSTKLNLAFTGGVAPDIICGAISGIASGVMRGQYEPLGSYVENWPDKDDIIDNLYEMGSYNGELYGLPYSLTPQLMAYRKDYFEEAGLDPEKAPSTWEEILDAAQKTMVVENGNITRSGISISVDGTFNPLIFARSNGADLFDEATGEYTVNTPEFVEAAEYMAELQKTSMPVNSQLENSQHPFTAGNAAISVIPVNVLAMWLRDVPEMADKIGFIIPEKEQKSAWVGANYMHISAESDHKELAWEFISMCFNEENVESNFTEFGLANVRKSLAEKYNAQNPLLAEAIAAAVDCGKGANKVENFNFGNTQIFAPAMQEIYYGGKSAQEALDDAKAQYDQSVQTE